MALVCVFRIHCVFRIQQFLLTDPYKHNKFPPRKRLAIQLYFFSVKVLNRWNSLPEPAVQVNSVNGFKSQLETLKYNQVDFNGQITRKGSPYSITERRVPELIPVPGSQLAGDVSHKPDGKLPLLSASPAVTPATLKKVVTNFAAW